MSRFISSYLLSKKLEYLVSYKISSTIKENLPTYHKMFKETNEEKNRGDLTHFVISFFDIIIQSISDLYNAISKRQDKLNYYINIITKNYTDQKLANVVFILVQNTLFGDAGLSVSELVDICMISDSKIREYLKQLETNALLSISKEGRRNKYDINIEVLENMDR